eukprot:4190267-Prymnesium_polylepis.1
MRSGAAAAQIGCARVDVRRGPRRAAVVVLIFFCVAAVCRRVKTVHGAAGDAADGTWKRRGRATPRAWSRVERE